MKQRLALTLTFMLSACIAIHAQVTIGSDNAPSKAALLDLKTQDNASGGVTSTAGGLLMPRVELQNMNSLAPFIPGGGTGADKATNKGLVVYNLTDNTTFSPGLYTWDGAKWVTYTQSDGIGGIGANNGLSMDGKNVQLGGSLTKATTIAQAAQSLSITSTNGSSSTVTFGTSNAALNLTATNKGFMPPRVALTGNTDNTTVPVTATDKGMVVYHTNSVVMEEGLYAWNGGSWMQLITQIPQTPLTSVNLLNLNEAFVSLPGHGLNTIAGGNMPLGTKESDGKYYLTIPEDGSFAFAFRIFGVTNITEGTVNLYPRAQTYYINIMKDGIILDVAELSAVVLRREVTATSAVQGFTTVLGAANLRAGDKVEFRFSHYTACSSIRLYHSSNPESAARTSLIYWKL